MSDHAQVGGEVRWRVKAGILPRRWSWSVVLAFGIAFTGTLLVAMLQGEKPFFNDAGTYWSAAATFTENGHFSLLNFNSLSIGYVLPLINHVLQTLATDLTWTSSSIVKVFNALTVALIGAVLGPAFMRSVWPEQQPWSLWRRLALTGLVIVFWSGFLNFPLSDFPGLAVGLLALVAVARTDSPGWMLLAGIAGGVAINMRPAYLLLAPAIVAIVAWTWFEQRGTQHASAARRALCAGLLLVGFAAVSLPQSLSAHRHGGSFSFIPESSALEPEQYYEAGMSMQAADTYVVEGRAAVAMQYLYPAGRRLLAEQKEGKVTDASQYVGLYVSHPLVMGGVIVGHVINGLDPLYSTPYVENLHNAGRTWGRIVGFLLVFLALVRLLWPAARRQLGRGHLRYLAALAVCCVPALPTGMERRYMLPVYLLSYMLALTPRWPNPIASSGTGFSRIRTPLALAVSLAAFTAVVWLVTGDAISHLTLVG